VIYVQQWNRIRDERHALPEEMGMLNTTSIQQILRRVDKAYQSRYRGRAGHFRFKSAKRFKRVDYRYGDGCKLDGDRLYIQHVGQICTGMFPPRQQSSMLSSSGRSASGMSA
jgi:hypothetical protein